MQVKYETAPRGIALKHFKQFFVSLGDPVPFPTVPLPAERFPAFLSVVSAFNTFSRLKSIVFFCLSLNGILCILPGQTWTLWGVHQRSLMNSRTFLGKTKIMQRSMSKLLGASGRARAETIVSWLLVQSPMPGAQLSPQTVAKTNTKELG